MSCVILNTMKLCINQAQTDISGEKVLSYINGVVNIEQEGKGGRITFPQVLWETIWGPLSACVHSLPLWNSEMVWCFNWKTHGVQTELGLFQSREVWFWWADSSWFSGIHVCLHVVRVCVSNPLIDSLYETFGRLFPAKIMNDLPSVENLRREMGGE